jgi:hypothetical protein
LRNKFLQYKCKIQNLPNAFTATPNLRRCASLSRLSSTAGAAAAERLLCLVFETAAAAAAAAGLDFGGNFDFEALLLVAIFNVVTSFFFVLL